ncbi:MAG: hypothetical protein EOM40_08005 [Clostridia bacterium]|nr:hypothetical protein [Clostridia bacterium]
MEKKKLVEKRLKELSIKEGMTETEIRTKIAYAISMALKSNDPSIQNFWRKIPGTGDAPDIEEITDYLILHIDE